MASHTTPDEAQREDAREAAYQNTRTEALLPADEHAEAACLGALLSDPDQIEACLELVEASDFHHNAHQVIYAALVALARQGAYADLITVSDYLATHQQTEDAGGLWYVSSLTTVAAGLPRLYHAGEYAQIVRRLATRRKAILTAQHMVATIYRTPDLDAGMDAARAAWADVEAHAEGGRSQRETSVPAGVALDELLEDVLARMEGTKSGITTGYPDLDRHLVSLEPKEFICVMARPGAGKSVFVQGMLAHNAALCEAAGSGTVEWVTLEMDRKEVMNRVICAYAGVNTQLRRSGFRRAEGGIARETYQRWKDAYDEFYPMLNRRLYVQDASCTLQQLRTRLTRAVEQRDCRLVVVDYLALLQTEQRRGGASRYEAVTELSLGLKALARDLEIPVVAAAQMNRGSESRDNKRPSLADARDSGQIEQDCSFVLGLYRPAYYDPQRAAQDEAFKRFTECLVLKARDGVGDQTMIPLRAELEYARFTQWPQRLAWPDDSTRGARQDVPRGSSHVGGHVSGHVSGHTGPLPQRDATDAMQAPTADVLAGGNMSDTGQDTGRDERWWDR